jgi:hypothetical protein
MANTFKLKTFVQGAVAVDTNISTYTVPAATTTIIIGLTVANLVSNSITVDVQIVSTTVDVTTNVSSYIGKDLPIPSGSSLDVLAGKVVLQVGDTIVVQSDTLASVNISMSIMEIT